jgi:hypothetical protein
LEVPPPPPPPPAGWCFWELPLATLNAASGTLLEARVRINSSSGAGVNQGFVLSVFDGEFQYAAWFRAGGVNLDGQPNVALGMTGWNLIALRAWAGACELLVNGAVLQAGSWMNTATSKQIAFGTWVGDDGSGESGNPGEGSSAYDDYGYSYADYSSPGGGGGMGPILRVPGRVDFDLDWLRARLLFPYERRG